MIQGTFIGVKEEVNTYELYQTFQLKSPVDAVLKATALGLYYVVINGQRVGDAHYAPGWTSYKKSLQVQSYDVSKYLKAGENEISVFVSEGWYKGRLAWFGHGSFYGDHTAALLELTAGNERITTDKTWKARTTKYVSSIYDGESWDTTAKVKPLSVQEVEFDRSVLISQISEPVRDVERVSAKKVITTTKGELVYDFGQNLTGVVEVKLPKDFDGKIKMQFAEILVDGNFYTDNLRSAKATDEYVGKGEAVFCPEFTFHGFRYMKLEGVTLDKENVTAVVRHTDMKRTGIIRSSNFRFNRLYQNVIWGQKSNFLDIPTDCPQRDERLGWTGDINAFCQTAAYNYDISSFIKKWLNDVRNDQTESGCIPHVVPAGNELWDYNDHVSAMWCDCVTMVPWKMYEMYGDVSFLKDNYEAMKKYVLAHDRFAKDYLIVRGDEYGDWLAIDNEPLSVDSRVGRTDIYYISSIFYAVSTRITARAAGILGNKKDEKYFTRLYEKILHAIQNEYFTPNGQISVDTVTAKVLALQFDIIPKKFREKCAKELADSVRLHCYRTTTGFIGSVYLLFVLADNGYFDVAEKLLMNNAYPGWFYEVDMGATTIWERWNSLLPNYQPNPDGMNSYNHYAYGSVMGFVYRRVLGVQSLENGFEKVRICPHPVKGLPELSGEYESVHGKIFSGYSYKDGKVAFTVRIPKTISAEIVLPNEGVVAKGNGEFTFERPWENLDVLPYEYDNLVRDIYDNPVANKAFSKVFGEAFTGGKVAWMLREGMMVGRMQEVLDGDGLVKKEDFPKLFKKANEEFLKLAKAVVENK